jgi:hypothetical protein
VLGESAFQAYNAGGENLIHITTADLDGNGAKDHVVVMSTEGTVLAYPSPASIQNPDTDARIWEFSDGPSMGIALEAADALPDSPATRFYCQAPMGICASYPHGASYSRTGKSARLPFIQQRSAALARAKRAYSPAVWTAHSMPINLTAHDSQPCR